jgi:hypothetical protein
MPIEREGVFQGEIEEDAAGAAHGLTFEVARHGVGACDDVEDEREGSCDAAQLADEAVEAHCDAGGDGLDVADALADALHFGEGVIAHGDGLRLQPDEAPGKVGIVAHGAVCGLVLGQLAWIDHDGKEPLQQAV